LDKLGYFFIEKAFLLIRSIFYL